MYLKDSDFNPLPTLMHLVSESEKGILINPANLSGLKSVFELAGVITESRQEILNILHLFCTEYNLLEIVKDSDNYYLRKING